jgi:hypothetical protein
MEEARRLLGINSSLSKARFQLVATINSVATSMRMPKRRTALCKDMGILGRFCVPFLFAMLRPRDNYEESCRDDEDT